MTCRFCGKRLENIQRKYCDRNCFHKYVQNKAGENFKKVIALYDPKERNGAEIGRYLGISRQRVHQILDKARKLQEVS